MAIRRRLAETSLEAYWPDVAMTAANKSRFYYESIPNQEYSLSYVRESLTACLPFMDSVPAVQAYASYVLDNVNQWGLDIEICLHEFENSSQNTEENQQE